jgi:hypothetical protein
MNTYTPSSWASSNMDYSFRLYLKAAKGDSIVIETKDPETGNVTNRRTPAVVLAENPPTPQATRANWQKARTRLLDLKSEVDPEFKVLEEVRKLCLQCAEARGVVLLPLSIHPRQMDRALPS